jgi:hypothetical protein
VSARAISDKIEVTHASIKPSRVTLYNRWYDAQGVLLPPVRSRRSTPWFFGASPERNFYSKSKRDLSPGSYKKVIDSIGFLDLFAQRKKVTYTSSGFSFFFHISMVTLTLPTLQRHFDTTVKRVCLNGFLTEMRERYGLKNYVWRAECQSNGNIHFHIATDSFLNVHAVRRFWNLKLERLGYISAYQNKFSRMSFPEYCRFSNAVSEPEVALAKSRYEFGCRSFWRCPNTVDIHKTRNIRNLPAYIAKYCAKAVESPNSAGVYPLSSRRISGHIWGLSQSLSKIKSVDTIYTSDVQIWVNSLLSSPDYRVLRDSYFTTIFLPLKRALVSAPVSVREEIVSIAKISGYCPVPNARGGYKFNPIISDPL